MKKRLNSRRSPRQEAIVRINKVYVQLYDIDCRYMVVYGGRRSSKSFSVSQLLVRRACENPYRKIVVMRKVATTLRLSVWPRILDALEEAGIYGECNINKGDREIELPNGSMFYFVGADDPQKLKSLEGATDFWLEEANEFDEIDLDTIDAGLSAPVLPCCQIWLTFNPVPVIENFLPWIAARYVKAIPHEMGIPAIDDNVCILRTNYKHNAFCPAATVKLFRDYEKKNPELYKIWVLGEYTKLEGAVFNNWDVVDHVPEGVEDIGVGLDFGFANDPAAAIRIWLHNDEIWLQGLVYKTDLSNKALYDEMCIAGVDERDLITADSAEPKSIEDLRVYGFKCIRKVHKRGHYKEDMVRRIHSFKVHLLRGDVDLVREFGTYAWMRDKNNKVIPKLQDGNDHYVDAFIMRMHDYYFNRELAASNVGADYFGF